MNIHIRTLLRICFFAASLVSAEDFWVCNGNMDPVPSTMNGKSLTKIGPEDRLANLYVPSSYNPASEESYPLVVILHGYGCRPIDMMKIFWDGIYSKNFFFVIPEGKQDSDKNAAWNARVCCGNWKSSPPDDVAYINGLVDSIKSKYQRVDGSRISVMGFSNGGFLSHHLVCSGADRYAAIVDLAGSMPPDVSRCKPGTAVSVLNIHGTDDNIILYKGGNLDGYGLEGPYKYIAAPNVSISWAKINQCSNLTPQPQSEKFNFEEGKGNHTTKYVLQGCPDGVKIEFWSMEGTGHVPIPSKNSVAITRIFEFLSSVRKYSAPTTTIEDIKILGVPLSISNVLLWSFIAMLIFQFFV